MCPFTPGSVLSDPETPFVVSASPPLLNTTQLLYLSWSRGFQGHLIP